MAKARLKKTDDRLEKLEGRFETIFNDHKAGMKELIQKLFTEFRVVLWKNILNELPKQEEKKKI